MLRRGAIRETHTMRIAGETVGRRGAAAISLAAVAAAVLAVHGYSSPGALSLAGSSALGPGHGSNLSPTAKTTPSPSAAPTSSASASPQPSGTATPGPLLSSTAYASYTYQLYPGSPSTQARLALAGFSYTAHRSGSSVAFTLFISGGGQAPVKNTYPASDHIYFVEANLGDDSGSAEYNFGDDGLIATDSTGHVVP